MKIAFWFLLLSTLALGTTRPADQPKNEAALVQIAQTWAQILERHDMPALGCILANERTVRMRAVVQRVSRAKVTVNGWISGEIGMGLLVLLGVGRRDTEADAVYLAAKIVGLRIFEDVDGKMNLSILDVGGSVLAISQFTLYGDARRGKRPSFDAAGPPEEARRLYLHFVEQIQSAGLRCETGRFQEMMQVESVNEGPVTILLDSAKEF